MQVILFALPRSLKDIEAPLGALMAEGEVGISVTGTKLESLNDAFEGEFSTGKSIIKVTIHAASQKNRGFNCVWSN